MVPLEGLAGWGMAGSGLHCPVHPMDEARTHALSASLTEKREDGGAAVSWRWAGPGEGARRRHLCQEHKDHGAPTTASPRPPGLLSPVHPSGNLLLRAELELRFSFLR